MDIIPPTTLVNPHMSLLSDLNEHRCNADWDEVSVLASNNNTEPSVVLAGTEAKAIAAESSKEDVKHLIEEIPREITSQEDKFIAAALRGHIYILSDNPRKALAALQDTFEVPPTQEPYIGTTVVKSRVLLGTAYIRQNKPSEAAEAMKSVNVSDRTLETNREAAIWATRLYCQLYQLEPSSEHKQAYQRAVQLGKLDGLQRVPALETTRHISTLAAPRIPSDTNAADSSTDTFVRHNTASVQLSPGQNVNPKHNGNTATASHLSQPPPQPHAAALNGKTPLQAKLSQQRVIESEAEKTLDKWRESTSVQLPLRYIVSEAQRGQTQSLFDRVVLWIEETFDSAPLMRMITELLVTLGKYSEAIAAFDTYVAYQKLQLLKASSGAHASPDDEGRSADIFGIMLSVISLGPNSPNTSRLDRIATFIQALKETMPTQDASAVGHANGILARAYTWQALNSVANDYLNNRTDLANKHFQLAFDSPWEGDAPTYYLKGLLLINTDSVSSVFEFVRAALSKFPDFLPLWHFLILLLSAENQYEDAQAVAEQVLKDHEGIDKSNLSSHSKRYLMEIKKTQVAIIEARSGIASALEELSSTLELVARLYPHADATKHHESIAKVQDKVVDTNHRRHKGARRRLLHPHLGHRHKTSRETPTGAQKESSALGTDAKTHLALIWLWVSEVYLRADLVDEARAAIKEAEELDGSSAATISTFAQTLVSTDPAGAWQHFTKALAIDYDNMGAVIGRANLLDIHGRVDNGIVDKSKSSVLFKTDVDELKAVRASLSALENLVNHHPGRNTPEAWCLYGITLDNLGDKTSAKQALWKSIQLEEKSGVRAYTPNLEYA